MVPHVRSLLVVLFAGCCTSLAGCPRADDAVKWRLGPPSVSYFSVDGVVQAVTVEGHRLVHTRQLMPVDREGNLVGDGSAEKQIEQVLANLRAVLDDAGSSMGRLVKLNVYADSPQTAELLREELGRQLDAESLPAITAVVTPLPNPKALVAVDAVAMADENGDSVVLRRCQAVAGDDDFADAAVMPRGGVVYLSGQPDKSPLPGATAKSLTKLLAIVDQLKLERSHVVQMKAFVQSAAAADEITREMKRLFPGQLTPPVVFVEWIASAPVEIEMIVYLPLTGDKPTEPVRYYTPPGVKASPNFSRVAVVQTERRVYISGLSARAAGNGEAQVRDVFAQLQQILSETDSDLRHLAKATYYVSNEDASTMLNKLRPEFYDPKRPPAASKAMVHGVGKPDRTLTMDMIAVGGK